MYELHYGGILALQIWSVQFELWVKLKFAGSWMTSILTDFGVILLSSSKRCKDVLQRNVGLDTSEHEPQKDPNMGDLKLVGSSIFFNAE